MKKLVIIASLSFAAVSAQADGPSDPVVEPIVIQQDAADSSANAGGLVLGLITLIVFGAAAGN
ncbi:hypothetical protein [Thalassococcus lentus]|uniref:Ferrochelatase n=1 Tax=Thalassococcus lentus TaxID=1210524 RepID=A0ABT4XXD5_9RHOB|nr:hypothetical protein [Thalassococcus lentus]MDA7426632.1 hypothetical protein [Thalassococcus lentus]